MNMERLPYFFSSMEVHSITNYVIFKGSVHVEHKIYRKIKICKCKLDICLEPESYLSALTINHHPLVPAYFMYCMKSLKPAITDFLDTCDPLFKNTDYSSFKVTGL